MKKSILFATLLLAVIVAGTSCKKEQTGPYGDFNTPATPAPEGLTGNWASGFASMLEVYDVYTGKSQGADWKSGKLFTITADGKNAEFYYTAENQSPYMQAATKAVGTIAFDEGSTSSEGSFMFYAGWAHYNGWSSTTTVNRDATKDELTNSLTRRYAYKMEGNWLRISPGEPPVDEYASSFELVN